MKALLSSRQFTEFDRTGVLRLPGFLPAEAAIAMAHATWRLDLPPSDLLGPLPAIRVFAFLEPVEPRGGGTPYIAGSHHVVLDRARQGRERLRSADMRAALKAEEPWLAALCEPGGDDRVQRFIHAGGAMRGLPVRVAEMTGAPGDVIVMHPAVFHTVAPNGLDRPRMMAVETFFRGRGQGTAKGK